MATLHNFSPGPGYPRPPQAMWRAPQFLNGIAAPSRRNSFGWSLVLHVAALALALFYLISQREPQKQATDYRPTVTLVAPVMQRPPVSPPPVQVLQKLAEVRPPERLPQ